MALSTVVMSFEAYFLKFSSAAPAHSLFARATEARNRVRRDDANQREYQRFDQAKSFVLQVKNRENVAGS